MLHLGEGEKYTVVKNKQLYLQQFINKSSRGDTEYRCAIVMGIMGEFVLRYHENNVTMQQMQCIFPYLTCFCETEMCFHTFS